MCSNLPEHFPESDDYQASILEIVQPKNRLYHFYSDRLDDSEEIIERSIEMTAKYLKINISEFESD